MLVKKIRFLIDVDAWSKLGDICQQYLTKGRQVLAEGRLVQDTWEKDGKKQSKLYVKADNVQFMGGKSDKKESNASASKDESIPF